MHRSKSGNWKLIWSFLKSAKLPWGHYILSSVVPFLATFIYIYLPELEGRIAAGEIFDDALVRKYILLSIVMVLLNIVSFYSAWVAIQFDRKIQRLTWRRLILMPMRIYEGTEPSTLISRITDDSTYVSELVGYIISVLASVYSAVLMVLSLFRMSTVLAAYTVPVIILNAVFGIVMQGRGYDIGYSVQDALSKYTAFLSERVYQLPVVKAMGTEAEELALGTGLSDERRRAEMRARWYEILISIVMEISDILVVGIVLMGGATLVSRGSLGIEKLISFYILAMTLPNTMQELLFQVLKMQQYRGAIEVISELATSDEKEKEGSEAPEALAEGIELRNVRFAYEEGGAEVLKGVSLSIPKGRTTAIVGPTGSGKTTVLKLIERFYDAGSGEILYDGREISDFNMKDWRSRFGYIVQSSPLISGSIRSNILYGAKRELTESELSDIIKAVRLDDFLGTLEDGLDHVIEGNGDNISGGQRQRIAIARALAAEPEILIMDEATSNLDAYNAKEVSAAMRSLMEGRTVIIVAHQMSTVRNADQIIVMKDGMVDATGDHESLSRENEYYRRCCEMQSA